MAETLTRPVSGSRHHAEIVAEDVVGELNLFERINGEIRDSYPGDGGLVPYLCECDHVACFGTVWLNSSDFDTRRAEGRKLRCPAHAEAAVPTKT